MSDGPLHPRRALLDRHHPARPGRRRRVLRRAVRVGARGRHAPGVARQLLRARLPGGDVGAVSSQPEGAPPAARGTRTYGWTTPTRPQRGPRRRRRRPERAVRRRATRAGWRSSPTRPAPRSACGRPRAPRRDGRQRARLAELQRPQHPRRRRRARVLRRGVRLGIARHRAAASRGRCPATATSSSSARPGCARTWRRWARPSASRTSSRASPDRRRPARHRRRTGA